MVLLAVNTGSSSVRLSAHDPDSLAPLARAHHRRAGEAPEALLERFLDGHGLPAVQAAAHRVVHGGPRLTAPQRVDAGVEAEIERLAPLAPLHNPAALEWVRACRRTLGAGVPQVAVFDTAFFAHLPAAAAAYALPRELSARHGLRRYGFHGLAHEAMWRRWSALRPDLAGGGRLISLQLGAGCSAAAVAVGRPQDTSMGFSPLEGLVMATRSGDVDPGLLAYLQREHGWSAAALERALNHESGLLGLSGRTGDMARLLDSDDPAAALAVEVFCHRARKYVGAYLAVLGGADGIVFGGGVGEHAPAVRRRILEPLGWCGLRLDAEANAAATGDEAHISAADSALDVRVLPVDEAQALAREAAALVAGAAGPQCPFPASEVP